jgi:GR25 family glycosyltransferase involved in LPS biosynthesis
MYFMYMSWTDGFIDHIFYINLAHRADKNDHMQAMFKEWGFSGARRIEGVTRYTYMDRLPPPEGINVKFGNNGGASIGFPGHKKGVSFTPGRFANVCSFYILYRTIIEENLSNVLVMEDDAAMSSGFYENIEGIKEELSRVDWDICYPLGRMKANKNDEFQHVKKFGKECGGTLEALFVKNAEVAKHIMRIMDPYQPLLPAIRNKQFGASDRRMAYGRFQGNAYGTTRRLFYQKNESFDPDSGMPWQRGGGLT